MWTCVFQVSNVECKRVCDVLPSGGKVFGCFVAKWPADEACCYCVVAFHPRLHPYCDERSWTGKLLALLIIRCGVLSAGVVVSQLSSTLFNVTSELWADSRGVLSVCGNSLNNQESDHDFLSGITASYGFWGRTTQQNKEDIQLQCLQRREQLKRAGLNQNQEPRMTDVRWKW